MFKLSRQLMNRAAANRIISKQETMIQAAGLDLVRCSDIIETVSLTGSYRLMKGGKAPSTMIGKYAKRDLAGPEGPLSLDQFFRRRKQRTNVSWSIIPHYVGGRSQPTYPVTEGYARSVLIIHRPWHASDKREKENESHIPDFEAFLGSNDCPDTVSIPYERVKNRYLKKTTNKEAVAEPITTRPVPEDESDVQDLLDIAATFCEGANSEDTTYNFDRGLDYDWGEKRVKVGAHWSW